MSNPGNCVSCGSALKPESALDVCPRCVAAEMREAIEWAPGDSESADFPADASPEVRERPGEHIGRYRLCEPLGEGGCGIVFLAEQQAPLRRLVALKILKPGMDTRQVVARFETERQALALMEHPHIASVFDGGTTESGRPFFVMELVRGIPITRFCDEAGLTARERLNLFVSVCHAVQHAHQKGIIHRDLKPSNVLVTVNDGVAVPKIIDFGIAKATGATFADRSLLTEFHQLIGTPAYMSPEQAMMTSLDVDTRSDVYSLGVLLYELLTGRPPLDVVSLSASGLDAVRRTIVEQDPPRPSNRLSTLGLRDLTTVARRRSTDPPQLIHTVQGDLDWVVMKCLEKDRSRRYESAGSLAGDIARHLAHEPVAARPPGAIYVFRKFVRRNRMAVGAGATVTAALVSGLAVSAALFFHERRTRERAENAEKAAASLAVDSQDQLIQNHLGNGTRELETGDFSPALASFAEAFRLDPRAEHSDRHQRRLASIWQQCPRPMHVWLHVGAVSLVRLSPDGKRVLSTSASVTALHDAETGVLVASESTGSRAGEAQFAPDGSRIVVGDSRPFVWDLTVSPPVAHPLESEGRIVGPRWNPEGTRFVTRTGGREAELWNAIDGRRIGRLEHPAPAVVLAAIFVPPDRAGPRDDPPPQEILDLPEIVLTADDAGLLRAWHPLTGALLTERSLTPKAPPWSLAEMDSNFLLTAQNGADPRAVSHARLWSLAVGRPVGEPLSHDAEIKGAAFAPSAAVTWSRDGTARVWDTQTASLRLSPFRHPSEITTASLSRDDYRLLVATGCADGSVRVWNRGAGRPIGPPMLHGSRVTSVAFGPALHTLVTGCANGTVRLWNIAAAGRLSPPKGSRPGHSWIYGHTWGTLNEQPDGVELRGLAPGEARHLPVNWRGKFFPGATSVSRDGRHLLIGQEVGRSIECQLFSVEGESVGPVFTLPGLRERGTSDPRQPLGRRRVFRQDNSLEVWDPTTGRRIGSPLTLPYRPHSITLSPDGRTLLWSSEGRVFVWDVDAAAERRPPITAAEAAGLPAAAPGVDSGPILPVGFSADGDRFLTTSDARDAGIACARAWNSATGKPDGPPLRHDDVINSAAFSLDDQRIVTASDDRTAKIWHARTGTLLTTIRYPDAVKVAAFGHDPHRLITIAADGWARLWDAGTGEALAAPLGHPVPALHTPYVVSLQGDRLLQTTWTFNLRWEWPDAPRPVADWQTLAELLSGTQREGAGSRTLTGEEYRDLWIAARTRMPEEFTTSLERRADWNRWMAQWGFGTNQHGAAVDFLTELIELEPNSFAHRWHRAYAWKSRDVWDAVADDLQVASRLAPDENAVWPDLAFAELVRGNLPGYQAACAEMARRLTIADRFNELDDTAIAAEGPNPPEVCQKLLELLESVGPPAETASEEARRSHWAARGMLAFRLGRYDEALKHLETAQRIQANDRYVLLFIAMTQLRLGHRDQARPLLDTIHERIHNDERIYLTGRGFDSHGNLAIARRLLEEAETMMRETP